MMAHRYLSLSAVVLLIYGCGGSDGDSTPPLPPALVSTLPTSPNVDSRPLVRGNTEPGASVRLYTEAGCAGSSVGLGLADGGGVFIAAVTEPVIGNADTAFQATATDAAGNVSNCSASLTYRSLIPGVSFSEPAGSPLNVSQDPATVGVVDLDDDGDLDLAFVNEDSDNVGVLLNQGDGTFDDAAVKNFGVGGSPQSVAIGDLDGNGDLDLVTANVADDNVSVLLNDGDGTFDDTAMTTFGVGNGPESVAIGDLDGDRNLDLVAANFNSSDVSVLLGNGDGTFNAVTGSPFDVNSQPQSVAIGDLNGDGRLDLVTPGSVSPGTVSVLLGNGNGTFTEASGSPFSVTATFTVFAAIGDLDGDERPDLVVVGGSDDAASVLLNEEP